MPPLVQLDPELSITPDIARSWKISNGGARFTFYLTATARWTNGAPVTAQDFEYAWKRALNPATGAPTASLLYDIRGAKAYHQGRGKPNSVGVRALDALTLQVDLEKPVGYFLLLLTHAVYYPVPPRTVEKFGGNWIVQHCFCKIEYPAKGGSRCG
jgi:ABC-type oligopeptide transport system substrate-binding subunit